MNLSVSLCMLMVSAVWAQGMNGMIKLDNFTDCNCWPDKYTALTFEKSAYLKQGSTDPVIRDGMYTLDFDYTMLRSRLVGMIRDPNTKIITNVTIWQDFKNATVWTYDGVSCHKKPLLISRNPVQCGRAMNATYFGSYQLGSMWVNTKAGPTQDGLAQEYFHMSQDCQPVAYVKVGATMMGNDPNPVRELENWGYANYKRNQFSAGTTDPFMMPAMCNMGAAPVGKRSVDTEELFESLRKVRFPSL